MRSEPRGATSSGVEVTSILPEGLEVRLRRRRFFLPFTDFPWFEHATVSDVFRVRLEDADHLYWPKLDVDLCLASIEHPERFPLVSPVRTAQTSRARGRSVTRPRR